MSTAKMELIDVSVQLAPEVVRDIQDLGRDQGISPADALARAIGRDRVLVDMVKKGGKVLVEDRHNKLYRIDVKVD
jgi:hypothetical protein